MQLQSGMHPCNIGHLFLKSESVREQWYCNARINQNSPSLSVAAELQLASYPWSYSWTGDLHSQPPGLGEHTPNFAKSQVTINSHLMNECPVLHLVPGLGLKSSYQIMSVPLTLSASKTSSGLLQQTLHLMNDWPLGWEVLQTLLDQPNERLVCTELATGMELDIHRSHVLAASL